MGGGGRKTKISIAVLVVALVFAAVLPVVVTAAGNSALQDILARSREVNRAVAHGEPWLSWDHLNDGYHIYSAFNMNATAVFSCAIVEGPSELPNLTVSFTVILPANATYYGNMVDAYFLLARSDIDFYDRMLGVGHYQAYYPDEGVRVWNATGIGFWNVTVRMSPESYPALHIPQNQSDWLSFTCQAETYLSVGLHGYGVTYANGTTYDYSLSTWFDFPQSPTTFYRFSYPVAAWLGYGSSILIAVASMCLLVHVTKRKQRKIRLSNRLAFRSQAH